MMYKDLNDQELLKLAKAAAKHEKAASLSLIEYLFEVEERKLYAKESYTSLYEYQRFSNSAAHQY